MMAEDTDLNIKIIEKKRTRIYSYKNSFRIFEYDSKLSSAPKNALIEPDKHL